MRAVRIAELAPARWRNGRGLTRDLGTGPGWRLSLAEIDDAGPFSQYPGLDRVFAIASGAVQLRFQCGHEARLDASSEPIAFRGEDAPHCEPDRHAGACRAINLMLERERLTGRFERRRLRAGEALDAHTCAAAHAVFVQQGRVHGGVASDPASLPQAQAPLAAGDAVFVQDCALASPAMAPASTQSTQSAQSAQSAPPPSIAALDDDTIVIIVVIEAIAVPTAATTKTNNDY